MKKLRCYDKHSGFKEIDLDIIPGRLIFFPFLKRLYCIGYGHVSLNCCRVQIGCVILQMYGRDSPLLITNDLLGAFGKSVLSVQWEKVSQSLAIGFGMRKVDDTKSGYDYFFFKQKTAYEI